MTKSSFSLKTQKEQLEDTILTLSKALRLSINNLRTALDDEEIDAIRKTANAALLKARKQVKRINR